MKLDSWLAIQCPIPVNEGASKLLISICGETRGERTIVHGSRV